MTVYYFLCICIFFHLFIYFNVSEQQYFEIEKKLIESNTKLEVESSSNEQLKEQLKELGKSIVITKTRLFKYYILKISPPKPE